MPTVPCEEDAVFLQGHVTSRSEDRDYKELVRRHFPYAKSFFVAFVALDVASVVVALFALR